MVPRSSQPTEPERLPKNFPALQERTDSVKRSYAEKKQPSTPRSPLENPTVVEKDDTFFLL